MSLLPMFESGVNFQADSSPCISSTRDFASATSCFIFSKTRLIAGSIRAFSSLSSEDPVVAAMPLFMSFNWLLTSMTSFSFVAILRIKRFSLRVASNSCSFSLSFARTSLVFSSWRSTILSCSCFVWNINSSLDKEVKSSVVRIFLSLPFVEEGVASLLPILSSVLRSELKELEVSLNEDEGPSVLVVVEVKGCKSRAVEVDVVVVVRVADEFCPNDLKSSPVSCLDWSTDASIAGQTNDESMTTWLKGSFWNIRKQVVDSAAVKDCQRICEKICDDNRRDHHIRRRVRYSKVSFIEGWIDYAICEEDSKQILTITEGKIRWHN